MKRKAYRDRAKPGSISLPVSLWTTLQERAARDDRSVSWLIKRAVVRDLTREEIAMDESERVHALLERTEELIDNS